MKNWKTTLAGVLAGLPLLIDALIQAYNMGAFTGKSGSQLFLSIGLVLLGYFAGDKKKPNNERLVGTRPKDR
jgi:hypothetical protein